MKLFVIGDEDTVTGFSLVGVSGEVAHNRDETRTALDKVIREGQVGIVFITEGLCAEMRAELDDLIFGGRFPLVLEIPDRKGSRGQRANIRQIVGRAVGVNV